VLLSAGVIIELIVDISVSFNVLIPLILLRYPSVEIFLLKMARFTAAVLIPAIVLLVELFSKLNSVLNDIKVLRFIGISVNKIVESGYAATCAYNPFL
jgi:hypothetical protein